MASWPRLWSLRRCAGGVRTLSSAAGRSGGQKELPTLSSLEEGKLIVMFPGQGAQRVGMAQDLLLDFPEAREVLEEVDEALSFSLSRLMREGDPAALRQTSNAQPALLAHSIAVLRVLQRRADFKLSKARRVQFALGHSLGEYSAACAVGCLSLAQAATLVRVRGLAMEKITKTLASPPLMSALMPAELETVRKRVREAEKELQGLVCEVANVNSPKQIVISGHEPAVSRAVSLLKEAGEVRRAVSLEVSAPFHCRLMAPAAEEVERMLKSLTLSDPSVPIISNVTAKDVGTAEELQSLLVEQVTSPVLWLDSVRYCMEKTAVSPQPAPAVSSAGENSSSPPSLSLPVFLELGTGAVLQGLVKQIDSRATAISLGTREDIISFIR